MKILLILSILIVGALVVRNAVRTKRMNAVLTSDAGRRYLANLEATGQATRTGGVGELGALVEEREGIIRDAQSSNIDLELIDAVFRDAVRHGQRDGVERLLKAASVTPAEGVIVAEDLYQCGEIGSAVLTNAIGAIGQRTGMNISRDESAQMCIMDAHALVWFTISSHLPVEEGKPLMQAHLDALLVHIAEAGVSAPRSELEATIGRQWMAYVQCPEAAGGQLIALASLILKQYIPADQLGAHDALAVAEIIIGIVKNTRDVLLPVVVH